MAEGRGLVDVQGLLPPTPLPLLPRPSGHVSGAAAAAAAVIPRSETNGPEAQETVHLQVLQSTVHQELQPADSREDAHRRAAVLVRHMRKGLPQTGSSEGSSVNIHYSLTRFSSAMTIRLPFDVVQN